MKNQVAFIDLFSGLGGFTTGAINAGATCIVSVDSWAEANRVHHSNHPNVPYLTMELGHPSHWKMFKRMVEKHKELGYHVHIHGSPPCQALSNASRHDPEKGMPLVLWYLDLVDRCEPDSWSMENVVPVRKRLPEGTPAVILNSADFGVPQTRRRCFAGSGWEARPTHTKEEWVSVLDALPHLNVNLKLEVLGANANRSRDTKLSEPSKTICGSGNQVGPRLFAHNRLMVNTVGAGSSNGRRVRSSDKDVNQPSLTINNNTPSIRLLPNNVTHNVAGASESIGEASENRDRVITEPSKVIRAHHTSLRDRTIWDKPQKVRSLTMPETLVLQGFPADYDMSAARTQKARWTMIGNAVPPPVAEAVIRGIHHGIHN